MMTIKNFFNNIDFVKEICLPKNDKEISSKILKTINNLDALNILNDLKKLDVTIREVNKFALGKKNFIVFGTGGSNLGAQALINILQSNIKVNLFFFDNIDPIAFQNSINKINLQESGFIIISKSGETPETLCQFASLIQIFDQKDSIENLANNTLIITEYKKSSLFNIAQSNKCHLLKHEENIGGRYSVFSNVGMVPAIIAGLDVKKIYSGALQEFENKNLKHFLKIGQFFRYQNFDNYLSNTILMTYSDALYYFGKWYLQLWAESIGKNNKGITAIHSIGTTDQHSQLQLYLDGPKDKFFTFITTDHSNKGLKLHNKTMKENNITYLINKTMGDLMQAEQKATIETFKKNNLKFREINLKEINEFYIGQLMAFSIMETVAACIYFEVNPFDQPAVEQGKTLTKSYLS